MYLTEEVKSKYCRNVLKNAENSKNKLIFFVEKHTKNAIKKVKRG